MEFENLQIEVPITDESSPMFAAKVFVSFIVTSIVIYLKMFVFANSNFY